MLACYDNICSIHYENQEDEREKIIAFKKNERKKYQHPKHIFWASIGTETP